MKKSDLSALVRDGLGLTWDQSNWAIDEIFNKIKGAVVAGETVRIKEFGSFKARPTAARRGYNPHTGERVERPPSVKVAFRASSAFQDQVKKGS